MRAPGASIRSLWAAGIALLAVFTAGAAGLAEKPASDCCKIPWGYDERTGPERWPSLSPCYAPCQGGEQSPIDIAKPVPASLPPLEFSYGTLHELPVENDGHTIEAEVSAKEPDGKVTLRIQGVGYRLVQFHFHTPSEHTVKGKGAPIEMHLVHSGPGGRLAVVGVFIREGEPNPELSKIWARLPKKPGDETEVHDFDLRGLLPKSLASYRYAGSLTTPACGQGVQWNVLASPLTLSAGQIAELRKIFSGKQFPDGNHRPVQPLNGRVVVTDVQPE
jgi:carbonic anhydrase